MGEYGHVYKANYFDGAVCKYDSYGNYISTLGTSGSAAGEFYNPMGIFVDNNGYIYIADTGNYRIQIFDSNDQFIVKFGSEGTSSSQFLFPSDVYVRPNGDIFVVDAETDKIKIFNSNFNFITEIVGDITTSAQFNKPSGISFDTLGNLYVADSGNDRIIKFNPYNPVIGTILINGTVKLDDFSSLKTGIVGTAAITDGINTETNNIVLDGRGEYSFYTTLKGNCTIVVKCSHWLSKTIYGVEIADGINIGEVTLTNGDVVENNEIDFSDINAAKAAYGSIEGDPNWNERADVDRSGEVDFTDINIVRSNYGEIGN